MTKPLAVAAVGGNALISDERHTALSDQYAAVCACAPRLTTRSVSRLPAASRNATTSRSSFGLAASTAVRRAWWAAALICWA